MLSGILLLFPPENRSEEPVVFVSVPDVHQVEALLYDPEPKEWFDFFLDSIAKFHPSFTLWAGDLGAQHWWDPKFQAICAPGGTLRHVVLGCANKAYGTLNNLLAQKNLTPAFIAVGDHDIGDNDWPQGARSEAVPYFKEAFAQHFTTHADGTSKFNGSLGGVSLRPIGTPYEGTSHAVRIANMLIVTIDEFRQAGPHHPRGTIDTTVGYIDGHLGWLDRLLGAARRDPGVEFIIVQGHLPVLAPVRAANSSDMFLRDYEDSSFWRVLRKRKVDLYFAGEVHQTTVTKDKASDIVQVVHGGGAPQNGLLVGRAYSKQIRLEHYDFISAQDGTRSVELTSTLNIDKSQTPAKIVSTGFLLKPIDPDGLQVHYTFDGDISKLVGNSGLFGGKYNARNIKVRQTGGGKLGAAASFNDNGKSANIAAGITPTVGNKPRTFSAWIKTGRNERYLWPSGRLWGDNRNNLFRVFIGQQGKLGLEVDTGKQVFAAQGSVRLDDLSWHHVAVTFPGGKTAVVNDVRFYIDGNQYLPAVPLYEPLFTSTAGDKVQVGGTATASSMVGWSGDLDDFAIWSSALSPAMINALADCANVLNYNASDLEALFKLYRNQGGSAIVQGTTWRYGASLSGKPGICAAAGSGSYSLILDAQGRGVSTVR